MMQIQKGDLLNISHSRSGNFQAIASADFDTETEEWYPIIVAPESYAKGLSTEWLEGERIPCRASHVHLIEKVEED